LKAHMMAMYDDPQASGGSIAARMRSDAILRDRRSPVSAAGR
jgi:hypothetical protein